MKNFNLIILLILPVFAGCQQSAKKMKEKPLFSYTMSVTAPKEYPVEVYLGHLSNADGFISAIPKAGIEKNGWTLEGSDAGMSANIIPSHLELTWISFTEKKFWKVDVNLPDDKILALFQKGYADLTEKGFTHSTYDHLVIGLAPGGVVVVWLQGRFFRTEVGRYQAKDTVVKKDSFRPSPQPQESEEQFYDTFFKNNTTPEIRADLKENGFPYDLWDKYRIKYNWHLRPQFYKPDDKLNSNYITYVNGEQEVFYEKDLKVNPYLKRPAPFWMDIYFADNIPRAKVDVSHSAEVQFDEKEVMHAFEELTKTNKDIEIELVAKVKFQFTAIDFSLVAGKKVIPLLKTKTKMFHFK